MRKRGPNVRSSTAEELAYARAYYASHREEIREGDRLYYQARKEERRQYAKAFRDSHVLELRKRRRANIEQQRVWVKNRKARKRNAVGRFTSLEWAEKCALFASLCAYCGESKTLTVDHRVPLIRGGTNYIANIVPACRFCNSKKGTRTDVEFLEKRVA